MTKYSPQERLWTAVLTGRSPEELEAGEPPHRGHNCRREARAKEDPEKNE